MNKVDFSVSGRNNDKEVHTIEREQLLKEMKRAKGCRFNASKRLERRDAKRTSIVAWASVSVIIITLLPVFLPVAEWFKSLVSLSTIAMSLAVLAFSLLQAQSNDPVKADQFHRCATEINELRRQIRHSEIDRDSLITYSKDYDSILRRYSINHDEIDYENYIITHLDEFPDYKEENNKIKNLSKNELLLENLQKIIAFGVLGLVATGFITSSQWFVDFMNGILKSMGLQ